MRKATSIEELAERVRKGPVHATGSGTKRHHGPAAAAAETVCLRDLERITHYEPGDLVVCVQAGARLVDVQAELGKNGQWLPIDPPYAEATIGGILATNGSGPRRLGYGTMRDLLIGASVVGSDGTVTKSGGRVVKNVTGYDMHKLHVGAFGTLGIVVEANFKVRPKPEVAAAILIPCETFAAAHAFTLRVHASSLRPSALEAMDGRLADLVDAKALAIVGVEASRPVLDRHVCDLKTLGGALNILEGAGATRVWDALRDLPKRLAHLVRVRIGARPHDLPKVLPMAPTWAHAGTGVARVDVEPGPGVAAWVADLNARAAAVRGYAVVESAPLDLPGREALPWGGAPDTLMRAIRSSRDPRGRLNPGRMAV